MSKALDPNRSISNLSIDKQAAVQNALANAKLQNQTIEKRKSVDSNFEQNNNNPNLSNVLKKPNQRAPSRKLEPLAENKAAQGNMKVNPFGGAPS